MCCPRRTAGPCVRCSMLRLCDVQVSTPTAPPGPLPTLLGARESDETTLPLLNRAILWSFVHLKAHSVHAPATSIRIVCENMMQSQASQLDKCKSMHVGQSKRVIDRAFMWRGALDACGNHRFKDPAPAPSSSASRAAAKSAHVRKFTCSHQVQYGWPPARGCWSACPPALQATYGPY